MAVTKTNDEAEGVDLRAEMARALAKGGMPNVHVMSLESAEEILTPKRKELIRELRGADVDSVRELARRLGRDKGQVSRDLQVLAENAVIHYETDGRSKAPRLTQDHIVIEPVV